MKAAQRQDASCCHQEPGSIPIHLLTRLQKKTQIYLYQILLGIDALGIGLLLFLIYWKDNSGRPEYLPFGRY